MKPFSWISPNCSHIQEGIHIHCPHYACSSNVSYCVVQMSSVPFLVYAMLSYPGVTANMTGVLSAITRLPSWLRRTAEYFFDKHKHSITNSKQRATPRPASAKITSSLIAAIVTCSRHVSTFCYFVDRLQCRSTGTRSSKLIFCY